LKQTNRNNCPTGCIHKYVTVVGSWHRDIEDDHEGKGIRDYTRTSKTPLGRIDLEESGETTEGGKEDTWGGVGVGGVSRGSGSGGDGGSGSAS